jgi:NlpC/P60 family
LKVLKLTISGILFLLLTFTLGTKNTYAFSIDKLITDAKNQIGVPYKWGGTTPAGFDCSGFINYVYNKQDISLPRTSADMFATGSSVAKSNLQPGDLVFFTTYKAGASHAGVYVGNQQFIHSASSGVKKSGLGDYYWKDRYIGARRYVSATATASAVEPTKVYWDGLLMVKGQIGKVKVLKATEIWKRTTSGELVYERTLQPGQQFRVYQYRSEQGGIYGLGGSLFVKKDNYIDYRTPSKTKLALLNGLQ